MMHWTRNLTFETNIQDNKLYVTLTAAHIHGLQGFTEERYGTDTIINYLKENNISFNEVITESEVFNYQSPERLVGTWVFSLPEKQKARRSTKPLENKESVSKIANKKTIKK